MKRSLLFVLLGIMGTLPASAQVQPSPVAARWIPAGTYVMSDFKNNKEREKTYRGANRERGRIASYLPGMTILYQAKKSGEPERKGYLIGTTQSGIPVAVLESDISSGDFSQRSTRDVVIHREHSVCKVPGCEDDKVPVGIGYSFSILSEDENEITLVNSDELRITYSRAELEDREIKGYLTRHKDRPYPRWLVYDGYANSVSTGCGEIKAKNSTITVPAAAYEGDPAKWKPSDDAWSLKAIEAFDLGAVQKQGSDYVGIIDGDIDGTTLAVDITVFAYRDAQDWTSGFYKFAGIISKVVCTKPSVGNPSPSYVKEALVFFDHDATEKIDGPIQQFDLKPQMSEAARSLIFQSIGRSLFYSINSPSEYEQVFGLISKQIKNPSAVSYIIARLNASCRRPDRVQCRADATTP